MTRRNGKIHLNALVPSSLDTSELAFAVEQRFLDLCDAWLRIRGVALVPPKDLDKAMLLWRTMRMRHRKNDLRNSPEELQATKQIAQWTIDQNMELRNQKSIKVVWA